MPAITTLDFKKYNRFFAFGCSFTQYYWPTWADLISKEISESYNYGKSGAGNHFIFNNLMECDARNKFKAGDLVIVKWTNVAREDRYVDKWWLPGNIYSQGVYSEDFVKQWITFRGCLIRDCAFIHAANLVLNHRGVDYAFLSMVPIDSISQWQVNSLDSERDVLEIYKESLSLINTSIYEKLYNFNWDNRPCAKIQLGDKINNDHHPLPNIHLEYILKTFEKVNFSERTINYAEEETKKLLTPGIITNVNYESPKKTFPVIL